MASSLTISPSGQSAEQHRVIRIDRCIGDAATGSLPNGVVSTSARASASPSAWPEAKPARTTALPRRSDRLPAAQLASFVSAQGVDVGQRHSAQVGTDLDDHATVGVVRGGANLDDDEVAVVLALAVLIEFGVLTTNSPIEVARRPTPKSPLRPWMVLMASWPGW